MKTSLLLLPGLLCDARLFAPQVHALSDIASPVVADLTGADTIAALATSAIARMPAGRFAVAGLSMGGYVALEVMRQVPERVSGLALLNTNARADSPESIANRHRLMALADKDFPAVNTTLVPKLLHPDHVANASLVKGLDDMAAAVGVEGFKRQQRAIIGRIDSRAHLGAIRAPAMVLAAREDAIMPFEVSEEMASGIPGAVLEIVEHCGHISSLEQPEAVSARLRAWMQRIAG
ncbi:Putative aminoacrylate hydrolase RutD [Usitatibacter rugosus]|uniref:Aminoacrylate hydrolase RutD n=1 Tax=Usitatibacter rugosus TaxID=2732067 RepID=A0A6M4GTE9_9PROT|nr:alpha/beta fold hydrolase [Usitatibacter rugosus]QJR09774.1 Putative aminoacrylate hydrolase RutD [Usitatibacter rugosus]